MKKGTTGKTFASLVGRICMRMGSIANAARIAGVDRGWLSKVSKGKEKPPSLDRLEEMIARWKLASGQAEALRQAALWEKANPAARRLLAEAGFDAAASREAAERATVIMSRQSASKRLYAELVPVTGYYTPGVIIPPADYMNEDEELFVSIGPVPDGSAAIKLLKDTAGFAAGAFLVFGPPGRPHVGLALISVDGDIGDLVCICQKAARKVEVIVDGEIRSWRREIVTSFRPFVAMG